jgi:hypothetical protein
VGFLPVFRPLPALRRHASLAAAAGLEHLWLWELAGLHLSLPPPPLLLCCTSEWNQSSRQIQLPLTTFNNQIFIIIVDALLAAAVTKTLHTPVRNSNQQ